ncbi:MAG: alcohol dehydrogenase catalytic domain-containing protein [Clostridia bacterium]|nr:alcohol dehydrogenase catalytic domain-containing protein [Clostridia bacterium]
MQKTAKCAVFMGHNVPFEVREYPVTTPPKGYGASRLLASGVCGTDLHIHSGRLGGDPETIIGHEFVGQLFDCDPAEAAEYGLKIGDNVIADIAVPCGECPLCLAGDDANCVRMQCTNEDHVDHAPYLFGGYAEVNYTPLANLLKIPEGLDPRMVCTFACPGPTALHAFSLAKRANIDIPAMKTAVVQGLGPVGMFAAMWLCAVGVENVYAVSTGKNPDRDALALTFGVKKVFRLNEENAVDAMTAELLEATGGLGVDLVYEASGAPSAVPVGLNLLRNRGVYLIPGQYSNHGDIAISPQLITFKALQILGSSQYSMVDVRDYLAFLSDHPELHQRILALGTGYAVEDVNRAFEDAYAGKNVKTMLVMEK